MGCHPSDAADVGSFDRGMMGMCSPRVVQESPYGQLLVKGEVSLKREGKTD